MRDSRQSATDVPLEAFPEAAAPLESILCSEASRRRPSRAPGHERESRALFALSGALADSPGSILQTPAGKIPDTGGTP